GRLTTVVGVIDIEAFVVLGGEGACQGNHHCHRVTVSLESVEDAGDTVFNLVVTADFVSEGFFGCGIRQFTVQQQVAGFEVVRVVGQLLDRVASVQQYTGVTINIGNRRLG